MTNEKDPVVKVMAPLEDGRELCDRDEIVCPFCQVPQGKTLVFGRIKTICKSCEKEFEVERKV